MMDVERFWQLVEAARSMRDPPPIPEWVVSPGGGLESERALAAVLWSLAPEEVVQFHHRYEQVVHTAYGWGLWGALFAIEGGVSYNAFEDFRWELVLCGRRWFERAVRDPDSLADHPSPPVGLEGLSSVPHHVYRLRTGSDDFPYLEDPLLSEESDPPGERWEEADLPGRYPRLWARFQGSPPGSPLEAKSNQPVCESRTAGSLVPGGVARVTEGAFQGHEGVVQEVLEEEGLVHLVIAVFGRPTVVELRRSQVVQVARDRPDRH